MHPRMSKAIETDIEFYDLVRFIPGSTISSLANMCGVDPVTATCRSNILVAAGMVKYERARHSTGKATRVVFPV